MNRSYGQLNLGKEFDPVAEEAGAGVEEAEVGADDAYSLKPGLDQGLECSYRECLYGPQESRKGMTCIGLAVLGVVEVEVVVHMQVHMDAYVP